MTHDFYLQKLHRPSGCLRGGVKAFRLHFWDGNVAIAGIQEEWNLDAPCACQGRDAFHSWALEFTQNAIFADQLVEL